MAVLDYSDISVKALSYSKNGTLHTCARKFELENKYKLNLGSRTSVTFSFGHAVGMAVQATAEGDTLEQALLRVFLEWDMPLDEIGTLGEQRGRKNVWFALDATEKWYELYHDPKKSDLRGWEVAQVLDPNTGAMIPGVELTFTIDCGDGFVYDGHIDLLMINHAHTKFKVVELKTNSGNQLHEAMYKNSMQPVGYSVVIDRAAQELGISNSYDVQYIIYKTKTQEFVSYPFVKTPLHRSIFLANLVTDINYIKMCEDQEFYPYNGSSCYNFFRPCEYFGACTYSDQQIERLALAKRKEHGITDEVFVAKGESFSTFNFTLDQLIQQQTSIGQDFIEVENVQE